MKLAFWKRKRSRRSSPESADPAAVPADDGAGDADDVPSAARTLRVRTRRRLIGAGALLLGVVILVPMLLDPSPRAVPDTIPIDLPSDKTPFTPHLPAAQSEPAPGTDAAAGTPAAPGSAADAAAVAGDAPPAAVATPPAKTSAPPPTPAERKPGPSGADAAKGDAGHAARKTESSTAATGKIYVQAAAMSKESAAKELASRLVKSGLAPFVERTDTSEGVRYRVRLGPFATRGDAERYRARLRSLGVHSNIVGA